MDLNRLRDRINNIDGQLLKLLADRRQVAEEIIGVKRHGDMPLRDSQREEHLLGHVIATKVGVLEVDRLPWAPEPEV